MINIDYSGAIIIVSIAVCITAYKIVRLIVTRSK